MNKIKITKKMYDMLDYFQRCNEDHGTRKPVVVQLMQNTYTDSSFEKYSYFYYGLESSNHFTQDYTKSPDDNKFSESLYEHVEKILGEKELSINKEEFLTNIPSINGLFIHGHNIYDNQETGRYYEKENDWEDTREGGYVYEVIGTENRTLLTLIPEFDGHNHLSSKYVMKLKVELDEVANESNDSISVIDTIVVEANFYLHNGTNTKATFLTAKEANRYRFQYQKHNALDCDMEINICGANNDGDFKHMCNLLLLLPLEMFEIVDDENEIVYPEREEILYDRFEEERNGKK